jgi:antitoxin (DNA-binding transcriptional repressor) of toxin-antitoxin stability system
VAGKTLSGASASRRHCRPEAGGPKCGSRLQIPCRSRFGGRSGEGRPPVFYLYYQVEQVAGLPPRTHAECGQSGGERRHMRTVNIHEAKTHLSRLVEDAAAGEEIVIRKAGKPTRSMSAWSASAAQRSARLPPLSRSVIGPAERACDLGRGARPSGQLGSAGRRGSAVLVEPSARCARPIAGARAGVRPGPGRRGPTMRSCFRTGLCSTLAAARPRLRAVGVHSVGKATCW